MSILWQPRASLSVLKKRARIIQTIRCFFQDLDVLEVDVPVWAEHSVSDPWLDALSVECGEQTLWLQTSPEYYMKRLLAAGSGCIYSLAKAFRADEKGRLHEPEFTMLEWYRCGLDDRQLIDELIRLINILAPDLEFQKSSYADLFQSLFQIDVHSATAEELELLAKSHLDIDWQDDKSGWLDLIFSHLVEPRLLKGLHVVYDYPECQAALARTAVNSKGQTVARRFECFINGVELANGYWELSDVKEQRRRFEQDNLKRHSLAKPQQEADPYLLAALDHGLPDCAGVALGIDRLVMALLELDSIAEQRTF
ncbi:EF-P lysine aminoacylase EpmA [Agaribacterium sp. ZY112]|uniref:EF-P lysine aminoacylase EpmA n=1 Tax=Agaribacterium sp. ZY112 TaxID=3233574 RepID=UPI00352412AA